MNLTTLVRATEQNLAGNAGPIALKSWRPTEPAGAPVFVLPNGYGLLPYAEAVCEELASRGRSVYSLDARGQGASAGEYSVPGVAEDIADAIAHVAACEPSVHLLAHCSAALPLIELADHAPTWGAVRSVVLYHYLADPQAHLERFRVKCAEYGVRLAADVGRLDCYPPQAYRAIPVPLAVIHPGIPANGRRADVEQLRRLGDSIGATTIVTPERGYDIATRPQRDEVRDAVERDILPLLG